MYSHFTTVHNRTDTRIRVKQTSSLAEWMDASVFLFVQDGQGNETEESSGVQIVDTGSKLKSRPLRMTLGAWRMWQAVRKARPRVAHFHDPELIPVGLLLKLSGVKVVYDVHESVPETIMKRNYLPHGIRKALSIAVSGLEKFAGLAFDRIVAATPAIAASFPRHKTVLVQNFPIKGELATIDGRPYEKRPFDFAYVGGITRERSAVGMVQALSRLEYGADVKLNMAGNFRPVELKEEMEKTPGWESVIFHGWADRPKMVEIFGRSRAGLVLFHPTPNHLDSQPNKLFEYMSAGLPVIASDFPLWRRIVEGVNCGLLVDPQNPDAIAEAMKWILENPEKAREMGENGKRAVEEIYNWEAESKKLIAMYEELLADEKGKKSTQG